jgi:hypothetical protein
VRQTSRQRKWGSGCLCVLATFIAAAVHAQAPEPASILPPRLVSMPQLDVPSDVEVPPAHELTVDVTVDSEGHATLNQCAAAAALCELISDTLARARFEPARRGDAAIAARVRLALRLSQPLPAAPASPPEPAAQPQAAAPNAATSASTSSAAAAEPVLTYGARGQTTPVQPGARHLELAEMRDLPGAFGDPFRAVDALPGVVPIVSGLPYFFIRGSPPAGTLYIYDDIPLPALYHLGAGPAAIHPRMVGPITLYAGVAPARYGRLTGGAIVSEGPERPDGNTHLEAELRLLDVSGYVQTKLGGGTLTAAARYGYPALLLSVFSPDVSLAYWDYQLRYTSNPAAATRFELVALGSYDSFAVADSPNSAVDLTYHRVEPRLIQRLGRDELGAALLFGWEESALGSGFQLQATRLGPRVWFEHRMGERNRLRLSADMQGISGDFSSSMGRRDLSRETSDVGLVGNVHARSMWGVQLELGLRPWDALELQFGARGDAWLQGGGAQAVLDPRLRLILHVSDALRFHVAAGVVHQPAVFYVPLPGIADLASDQGLQTALQSEVGVGWDSPWKLHLELQLFAHRYKDLVFLDTLLLRNALDTICSERNLLPVAECMDTSIPKRLSGVAYGTEVFLRRPITERLSGFVSYTLAFASVGRVAGLPYTPSWDVRHVANLVLQYRVLAGLSLGVRWFIRSGKTTGDFILDETRHLARDEQRLPFFTRLDADISYAWQPRWGRMRVALEWFNVTMSREPLGVSCDMLPRRCRVDYIPAIFFPNLSVRAEH